MTLKVFVGDITKVSDVDAIVNAANGVGIMGAGVAGAIAKSAGTSTNQFGTNIHEIVAEVVKRDGPFDVGDVYITGSGLLARRGVKHIYHAVTMKYPGGLCSIGTVEKLVLNLLNKALSNNLKSIAMGGLGCGIGGLDKEVVAKKMASLCEGFAHKIDIYIVDINRRFIDSFVKNCNIKIQPHNIDE